MADDSDSSLSSAASEKDLAKLAPIFTKAKLATKKACPPPHVSPPRPKRPPSPLHEPAFEDNADIAFIVMFRARFNDAFPPKLPHFGPQNIERGVTDQPPSQQVEDLLCALLGLVLNRKKPVERGHHGRALEEAVLSQKNQWPYSWLGINPLHGNRDFNVMPPSERLNLLRTLIMWSLTSSEAISAMIKDKYKQVRHNDDENQALSVQPWGTDGDKRRYFLIEGHNDTSFRVYREGSRYTKNAHWYSVAGDLVELRALATKLQDVDGSQAARRLAARIAGAMGRLEDSEVRRQRREQRQMKMASFARPEPGLAGLYEGRTRGKRMRYTYEEDDEQNFDSDAASTRRSARNISSRNTPMEARPTVTLSGRQSRKPRRGEYGELLLDHGSDPATAADGTMGYRDALDGEDEDSEPVRHGRSTRNAGRYVPNGAANPRKRKNIDNYNSMDDDMSDEDDAANGDGWDSDRNEADDGDMPDADDDSEEEDEEENEPRSLMVKLKVPWKALTPRSSAADPGEIMEQAVKQGPLQAAAAAPEAAPRISTALTNGHAAATSHPVLVSASELPPPLTIASAYPTPASFSFPAQDIKLLSGVSVASSIQPAQQAGLDNETPHVNASQAAGFTTPG